MLCLGKDPIHQASSLFLLDTSWAWMPELAEFQGDCKVVWLNQNTSSMFPRLCHLTPPLLESRSNGWCMSCGNVQWEVAPITTSDLRSRSCNAIKDGRAWNTDQSPSVKNIAPLWCPEALLLCCLSTLMPRGFIALLSQLQRHNWKLYLICRQCYPVRIVMSAKTENLCNRGFTTVLFLLDLSQIEYQLKIWSDDTLFGGNHAGLDLVSWNPCSSVSTFVLFCQNLNSFEFYF